VILAVLVLSISKRRFQRWRIKGADVAEADVVVCVLADVAEVRKAHAADADGAAVAAAVAANSLSRAG
jgi:hypothetical protein